MILRLRKVNLLTQGLIQEWQPVSKALGNTSFACLLLWSQHESITYMLLKHFSCSHFFFSMRSSTGGIYSKASAPWSEWPSPRISVSNPTPSLSLRSVTGAQEAENRGKGKDLAPDQPRLYLISAWQLIAGTLYFSLSLICKIEVVVPISQG